MATKKTDPEKQTDAIAGRVQDAVEQERGFRGAEVDPTPNENYTVRGVSAGKPTPETDEKAAESARVRSAALARGQGAN